MRYKKVPKTKWDVSQLGFGCMRFKDEETAIQAVRKAVELGVNYFDVAPLYGGGTAEPFLGKAIRGIACEKIIVTAKSSPGNGGTELCDYNPSEAINYCAERGMGVVAMNPLGGGRLGRPVAILNKLARRVGCNSMAEAALRFVIGQPGVTTALNGITFGDHAVEGAGSIDKGPLSDSARKDLVSALSDLYRNVKHFCTACGYCGECPEGILIPEVLQMYTSVRVPILATDAKAEIRKKVGAKGGKHNPAACTACKQCEKKCPNNLPVSELMVAGAGELSFQYKDEDR